MLQNIRKNVQGPAAKVIIALIIVPFALFGIDSFFGGSGDSSVARVNDEKIPEFELQRAIALQKRQLLAMMGDSIDPALLDDSMLRQPALEALIRQKVLLQDAERKDVRISDTQLNRQIVSMSQFHEGDRFSQERYEQILRSQGFTSGLFKSLLRADMLVEQINGGVAGSTFLTDTQKDLLVRLGEQKRSFHYVRLPLEKFEQQTQISDEEIQAYYEAHSADFQSEPQVRLAYIEVRESDFYQPVDEETLRAEYQRLVDAAAQREERHAAHIMVEFGGQRDRAEALARIREVQQKLAAGADFAELAREYSDDAGSASQGGDVGFTAGDTFPDAFEAALAELEKGQVSGVVETDTGLHLVKLLETRRPDVAPFEQEREAIAATLQSQQARPELITAVEQLKDLVFNAENLRGPAAELGMDVRETDWLVASSTEGLFQYPSVKKAAFDRELREQGLNSEVFELAPTHYVVVRPVEYRAPETKPLAEVRDGVAGLLKRQKAAELADAALAAARAEAEDGKAAEEIAKGNGYSWQVAIRSPRIGGDVKANIRATAFAMPRPGDEPVTATLVDDNGDRILVQLIGVFDGDPAVVPEPRLKELYASALRAQAGQNFSAYFNELYGRAEIKIN